MRSKNIKEPMAALGGTRNDKNDPMHRPRLRLRYG
jgi:hypothetical protein